MRKHAMLAGVCLALTCGPALSGCKSNCEKLCEKIKTCMTGAQKRKYQPKKEICIKNCERHKWGKPAKKCLDIEDRGCFHYLECVGKEIRKATKK